MPDYQVLIKRTVWENFYVHAGTSAEAIDKAKETDYYDSDFLESGSVEIVDVEKLD